MKKKPVLRFNQDLFYYELGLNYIDLKKYKEAINILTDSIKINPNNFRYYESLALCLQKTGDLQTSELYYKKANELKK